jgi:uncharacterized protein YcbK (DUF882 family)
MATEGAVSSRRGFLTGLAAAALTLGTATDALAARRQKPARTAPAQAQPARYVELKNPHTGDTFRGTYWENGRYEKDALAEIDWLMRDFRLDEAAPIDPSLLDQLSAIQRRIGPKRPIFVMSGYRSPETNQMLREEGIGAAENSLHVHGKAVDIHIERVRLVEIRKAALALRAGGVGTYFGGNFIHLDTGRTRYW